MPVRPDAEQLNVDGPRPGDQRVVLFCGSEDVVGYPVGTVHVRRVDVEMVGELRPDDVRVRLRMTRWQTDVLVQQERLDTAERETFLAMPTDQIPVDRQRRRTRRQTEGGGPRSYGAVEDVGDSHAAFLLVLL